MFIYDYYRSMLWRSYFGDIRYCAETTTHRFHWREQRNVGTQFIHTIGLDFIIKKQYEKRANCAKIDLINENVKYVYISKGEKMCANQKLLYSYAKCE